MADIEEKMELARLISTVHHRLHHHHLRRVLADMDTECPMLSAQQIHVILAVRERSCVTIKQLTQILYIKAPAVSVMVDKLVEMGLLTREENPADRREVLIRVAPEEDKLIAETERRYLLLTVDLLDKIGMDYARMWGDLCKRIEEILSNE